ncbi:MAG: class IV adenylate cyclase [Flammeovirgaceae bacterium]
MAPLSYQDYTIKARARNFDRAKALLQQLGAKCLGTDLQTDTYFATDKGKLKLRVGTIEHLITHYERVEAAGMEKTVVYRYDLNPSPAEVEALRGSFAVSGEIKKERTIYLLGIHKIHLDRLDGNHFIEIESIDRNAAYTSEELKALCLEMKEKLGIADADLIPTGYFTRGLS